MFVRDRLVSPRVNKKMMSFRGAGCLGQNYVTWGQTNSTGMPPDQKVNKAEELTYPISLQTE